MGNRKVLNLRWRLSDGKFKGGLYSTKSKDKLKSHLEKCDGKYNMYVTLNPVKLELLQKIREEG